MRHRHHHGQPVRLGDDAARRRHARPARRRLRDPHRLGAPHPGAALRVCPRARRGAGLKVIIAGAGGAAHLPGMAAAMTTLPVLGVPVESRTLRGVDSLLSIVQMPAGVPVATFAIGQAGAVNAALFAAAILALADPDSRRRAGRVAAGADRRRRRAPGPKPARHSGQPLMLPPGEHDRHSRRRPARPHDRAGRRPARLSHAHLRQRARFPGRAGVRRGDDRAVRRRRRARPLRRRGRCRDLRIRERPGRRAAPRRRETPGPAAPGDHRDRPGPAARKDFPALDRRRDGRVPRGRRARRRWTRRCASSAGRRAEDRPPGL